MRYAINTLNEKTGGLLRVFTLTEKENFSRNRKTLLYRLAGIEVDNPSKAIEQSISLALFGCTLKGKSLEKANEVISSITDRLLSHTLSPYDAIGEIKERVFKKMSTSEMTQLWTKLSVISALELENKGAFIPKEVEAVENFINEKTLTPKLLSLQNSLTTENKKKYTENRPHLSNSLGKDTNWAEILGNITTKNSAAGALAKRILQSDEGNILKQEAVKECLYPAAGTSEKENKRLNKILDILGARPSGRAQRYAKIYQRLDEHGCLPPPSTSPVAKELTEKDITRIEKITNKCLEDISSVEKENSNSARAAFCLSQECAEITKILSELKRDSRSLPLEKYKLLKEEIRSKIDLKDFTKSHKELYGEMKNILLDKEIDKEGDNWAKLLPKNIHQEEKRRLMLIERLVDASELEDAKNEIKELEDTGGLKDFFCRNKFDDITNATALRDNSLDFLGEGLNKTLLKPTIEGKKPNLEQKLGHTDLSLLHVVNWWKSKDEVKTMVDAMMKEKISLNQKDSRGRTPLHKKSKDVESEVILVKAGANYNIKNNDGLVPLDFPRRDNLKKAVFKDKLIKKGEELKDIDI